MSAHLAKLVGKAEKEVAQFITDMEDKFGNPSADVRLLAEINQLAQQKMADLGLDPRDTTGRELYHALGARFDRNAKQIDRAIGISPDMSLEQRIDRALQFVRQVHGNDEVWVLKNVPAKELLRALPPKKTMARLHYRSLESLLKRENLAKVLLCTQYFESAAWQKSFVCHAKRLSVAGYEQRPVIFLALEKMQSSSPPEDVAVSKLGGTVAIWPDKRLKNASGLYLIISLLRGLNKLGVKAGPKTIAHAHPLLNWWADAGQVLSLHGNRPVSFNLHDVAINHLRSYDYPAAVFHRGTKSLWAELLARYANLGDEILPQVEAQIDNKTSKLKVPTVAQLAEDMVRA
ncbi:hypothetical protein HYS84_01890 [Candidatus Saccharibacteria bacterium]|nr:hypothetical protein [Candidatus Saccharibacteria bacterium]